jgi:hypothetical protein
MITHSFWRQGATVLDGLASLIVPSYKCYQGCLSRIYPPRPLKLNGSEGIGAGKDAWEM